jgi:hypothetical protein
MFTYTLSYRCLAVPVTPAALGAAMAAVVLDSAIVTGLGLTPFSDTTTPDATGATRVIVYTHPTDGTLVDDLTELWTGLFYKSLSCPVVAAPVTVV